jgi:predicted O-methyltransferase YrrM
MTHLEGWCSPKKAAILQRWVQAIDAQLCVEIGVFGGASLIPQALACQAKGSGKVFGIDPYSPAIATEFADELNAKWWREVDFASIKSGFLRTVRRLQLTPYVELLEMTSAAATSQFTAGTIDLLHIDGNHSAPQALADVVEWLPRVRVGGLVFIDDISWGMKGVQSASTGPAIEFALQHCSWLGVVDQCLICRKRQR